MSKRETPATRWYWEQVGGTLVEEFPLTPRTETSGGRWADAIILPNEEHTIASRGDVEIDGKDVVVVQTKAERLGMYLMGRAVFSPRLLRLNYQPESVRSIALVRQDDDVLHALLDEYADVEVVVAPPHLFDVS